MKPKKNTTTPEKDEDLAPGTPVRETDPVLTPKAEAKAANKLPKADQLEHFEEDLEEHDPGNQPA